MSTSEKNYGLDWRRKSNSEPSLFLGPDVDLQHMLATRRVDSTYVSDLRLNVPPSTQYDFPHGACCTPTQVVKDIKGVPITRMVAFKEGADSRISDKHLTWSLSRNGLYAGDVLVVRFSNCIIRWCTSTPENNESSNTLHSNRQAAD